MYKSNDCIKLVKHHLRNYHYYKQAIINIADDIACKEATIADDGLKATDYSKEPTTGSSDGLNVIEMSAEIKMKLRHEVDELRKSKTELERQLSKIDKSIEVLQEKERNIIDCLYRQKMSYSDVMQKSYISESTVRRTLRAAERHIAVMIYGKRAEQDIYFM